jgi:hypothetical protein
MHIYNSTRGHEIVHDIRDAVLYWKQMWKKVRKVSKNIEIVDNGRGLNAWLTDFTVVIVLKCTPFGRL